MVNSADFAEIHEFMNVQGCLVCLLVAHQHFHCTRDLYRLSSCLRKIIFGMHTKGILVVYWPKCGMYACAFCVHTWSKTRASEIKFSHYNQHARSGHFKGTSSSLAPSQPELASNNPIRWETAYPPSSGSGQIYEKMMNDIYPRNFVADMPIQNFL